LRQCDLPTSRDAPPPRRGGNGIPIPRELALLLSAALARSRANMLVSDELDAPAGPWAIQRAVRAKTTLDVYGHLWPDKDEASRAAVAAGIAIATRAALPDRAAESAP
jgi:hypothetical protein